MNLVELSERSEYQGLSSSRAARGACFAYSIPLQ